MCFLSNLRFKVNLYLKRSKYRQLDVGTLLLISFQSVAHLLLSPPIALAEKQPNGAL